MLKQLKEYCLFLEISGFKNVRIKDAKILLNSIKRSIPGDLEIQFLNAGLIASWQHLYFATLNALMAFTGTRNISKSLGVEIALYASAQHQIRKAIDLMGVKPDTNDVAVLVIGKSADLVKSGLSVVSKQLGLDPDESVLNLSHTKNRQICKVFEISDLEIETVSLNNEDSKVLVDLVIERVALLSARI